MPIEPTPIPPVPTPVPTADDPTNFPVRGDAIMEWLPDGVDGIEQAAEDTYGNALEVFQAATDIAAAALVAADAAGRVGRSVTPLAVSAGVKNITLVAAKAGLAVFNKQVAIKLDSDASVMMFGTITGVTSSTAFAVTVTSGGVIGAGNFSNWQVIDAAFFTAAATAIEVWTGNRLAPVTGGSLSDASDFQAFTDAATITLDFAAGYNRKGVLNVAGSTRLLANPVNTKPGYPFCIELAQDATGSRAWTYGSKWIREGSAASGSTAANAKDYLVGICLPDGYMLYDIIRNPVT